MKKTIILTRWIIVLALVMSINITATATALAPAPEVAPIKTEWTQKEVRELTDYYADMYGVSSKTMHIIVNGESGYQFDQKGDFYNGQYNSFGACQIHLPDHPNISKEQALNPEFCLDWMAQQVKAGRARLWTVYRVCLLNEVIIHNGKVIPCTQKI